MPSTPNRAERHYSSTLQDFTLAYIQDDAAFVAGQAAPAQPVPKKEATYYTYSQGDWLRNEMKIRGTGERAARAGWHQSTDTYHCNRKAVAHDEDWADMSDADPAFNIDEDNADYLAGQAKMNWDYEWTSVVMQPATWTTDYDGVASSPSANELLQWNDSSSDPQKNVQTLQSAIHSYIGRYANVMVVGADVHAQVLTNTVVRAAIQYTAQTTIANVMNALAGFFGVEKYLVARGIYNTGPEGGTDSISYITNKKDMWLGYVDPRKGRKVLTAAKTFAWTGPDGVGQDGIVTSKYDIEDRKVTSYELEQYIDIKIVAASAGAFVDDCVA